MPVNTSEEAKEFIKTWLVSRSLLLNEVDHKSAVFQIDSKTETGIAFAAIQPTNLPRSIIITTKIEIDPMHSKALKSTSQKKRIRFIWKLKKELMVIPPTFLCYPLGGSEIVPESIRFMKEISFDELTEGRLIEAMDQTCRGVILTAWIFLEEFGAAEA